MLKVLLALLCLSLPSCSSFYCENTIEKEILSPNGKLKAIMFDRGCGATTGFVTGISIVEAGRTIDNNETGNALTANAPYIEDTAPSFLLEWTADDELLVGHPTDSVISKADRVHDVRINFRDLGQ